MKMATYHFGVRNHEHVITMTVNTASILFSANTFSKIKKYFDLACIRFISHTSYYNLQKDYLFEVANEARVNEEK